MSRTLTIGRRRLIALVGGLALSPLCGATAAPLPVPSGGIAFSVWRNGSEIGSHTVHFEQEDDRITVRSEADFAIKFGPIVLYRYTYNALETWRGGELQSVRARTDDNGDKEQVDAVRSGASLIVTGTKSGKYIAPPGAIAATHWNEAELNQPMINPQNGELMRFERRDVGRETLASGIDAQHVALSGYATLDLWYDDSGRWSALRAVAKDGSIIDYHPR